MADPLNSLFVYGTLMRGEIRHPYIERRRPPRIRPATVSGWLFHLGEYPGLLCTVEVSRYAEQKTGAAPQPVMGELVDFADLTEVLPALDEMEGDEYRRVEIEALADGDSQRCWTYEWLPSTDGVWIPSSNWREISGTHP